MNPSKIKYPSNIKNAETVYNLLWDYTFKLKAIYRKDLLFENIIIRLKLLTNNTEDFIDERNNTFYITNNNKSRLLVKFDTKLYIDIRTDSNIIFGYSSDPKKCIGYIESLLLFVKYEKLINMIQAEYIKII
jgi:hypothetical protein